MDAADDPNCIMWIGYPFSAYRSCDVSRTIAIGVQGLDHCNSLTVNTRFVMKNNNYERVSGIVFGIVAALQATRAILQVPAQVGAHEVPVWISWVAVVVTGALCRWAFRTARQGRA